MPSFSRIWSGIVLAAAAVTVSAVETKDHDKIVGFADVVRVAGSTVNAAYIASTPFLKVIGGCVPFPAVDKDGYVSAGLKITGSENGDCASSTGQVYGRTTTYNGKVAVMWSWYFPKDDPLNFSQGHRHDWENLVVWFDDVATAKIYAISYSGHGEYDIVKSPSSSLYTGGHPFAKYYSQWPLNHQIGSITEQGGTQPAITWETLPDVAKASLEAYDFGAANVPFKEANFLANLAKAWVA